MFHLAPTFDFNALASNSSPTRVSGHTDAGYKPPLGSRPSIR